MNYLESYELFEHSQYKAEKRIVVRNESNADQAFFVTVDGMNQITEIENPFGIKHKLKVGDLFGRRQFDGWLTENKYKIESEEHHKRPVKKHSLIKFIMKKGYR